jgi:hypothetical protein
LADLIAEAGGMSQFAVMLGQLAGSGKLSQEAFDRILSQALEANHDLEK